MVAITKRVRPPPAPRRVPAGVGRWGKEEHVEPSIRRLVAERLGIDEAELVTHVSLREDLAADAVDLLEVAVALEREFAIGYPTRLLDRVRTYGDLVGAIAPLIRARGETRVRGAEPLRVWAHLVPPPGAAGGVLAHAGWLSPYAAETIAAESLHAGPGTTLTLTVAAGTDDVGLACVRHQFAWLAERGVALTVRRDDGLAGSLQSSTSHAVEQQRSRPSVGAP